MKVAKSISIDTEILSRIEKDAALLRDNVSRWIEDACLERLQRRESFTLNEEPGQYRPREAARPESPPKRRARG